MKKLITGFLIFFSCFVYISSIQAETYEEMYERVFGIKPETKWQDTSVEISYNNQQRYIIPAQIIWIKNKVKISKTDFITQTKNYFKPDFFHKIKKDFDSMEYIELDSLKKYKITYVFNRKKMFVSLDIPSKYMNPLKISISKYGDYFFKQNEPQHYNGLSGYMNISISDTIFNDASYQPLYSSSVDLHNVINYRGYIFKTNASQNNYYNKLFFNSAYIEKDYNDNRLSFGSINNNTYSYQSSHSMLGLNIESGYSITKKSHNLKQFPINVSENSNITIRINNKKIFSKVLKKGNYILSDFPFDGGHNKVYIKIKNLYSKSFHIEQFDYYDDYRILSGKSNESNLYIGRPLNIDNGQWNIHTNNTVFGYYQKNPVSERSAEGYFFHKENSHGLLGYDYFYAIPLGIISFENTISHSHNNDNGYTSQISLENFLNNNTNSFLNLSRWRIGSNFFSKKFYFEDDLTENGKFSSWGSFFQSGHKLGSQTNLSLAANQQVALNKKSKTSYYATIADSNIARSSITYLWEKETGIKPEWTIIYFASLDLPLGNSKIEYKKDINNKNADINLSGGSSFRVYKDKEKTAELLYTVDGKTDLRMAYKKGLFKINNYNNENRWENITDLKQTRYKLSTYYKKDHVNKEQQMTYKLDTAIAYADGTFAISRPINNCFVIVNPSKNLNGKNIPIRKAISSFDGLGPIVLTEVQQEKNNRIVFDTSYLPLNINVKQNVHKVYLSRFSGKKIELYAKESMLVSGKIRTNTGSPVKYAVGSLTNTQTNLEVTFFTNKKGLFQISGIIPGEYIVTVKGQPLENSKITVIKTDDYIYKIKDIVLIDNSIQIQKVENIKSNRNFENDIIDTNKRYLIIVGSSTNRKLIDKLQSKLIDNKLNSSIIEFINNNKPMYRLISGSFERKYQAEEHIKELKRLGINANIIEHWTL